MKTLAKLTAACPQPVMQVFKCFADDADNAIEVTAANLAAAESRARRHFRTVDVICRYVCHRSGWRVKAGVKPWPGRAS